MTDINVTFSRTLLSTVLADVKAFNSAIRVKDAWVWQVGRDHWEFHFGSYYWHGSADNAYDARAKGWSSFLASVNAPGYER